MQCANFPPISSYITLPRALEEEPNDQHLQRRHPNHHRNLNQAEVKNPALRAPHRAKVSVLARPEILLHPRDGRQLGTDLEDRVFKRGCLFGRCAAFHGEERGAGFVLKLC